MAVTVTNTNYGGEFLQEMFLQMRQGSPTLDQGHVRLHTGIHKTVHLPRIITTGPDANIIQSRAATPSTGGTAAYAENTITTGDYMIYLEFNPAIFEDVWRPFQPQGRLVFSELAPEVQIAFMSSIMAMHGDYIETAIWQASTAGAAPYDKFNGIFRVANQDATVLDTAAPAVLSAANIIGELTKLYNTVPAAVRYRSEFKIFLPQDAWEFYGTASYNQTNKGIDETQAPGTTFRGKTLVPLPGIPTDKMLAAVSNNTQLSNIHVAIHAAEDLSTLLVERLQNNSELYFFKLLCKAGTGFGYGGEIAAYNA